MTERPRRGYPLGGDPRIRFPLIPYEFDFAGGFHRKMGRCRTGMPLRGIPVFRMTFSVPTAHCAVGTEKAMLQVRFAASGGRGELRSPLHPPLPPPRCRVLLLHKRWFFAGGRTERQRGWLPAQFLSLEEKRSHSRRGRRRRPLFPHGSCPVRGRSHGGTLCTTKPVRTELGFRTHRLSSSGE